MATDTLLPGYHARPGETMAARFLARVSELMRAVLLVGAPGTGKTFFAECFAKGRQALHLFVPCHPWLTAEEMQQGIDIGKVAVGVNNADDAYLDGQLLRAVRESKQHEVVLVLDEVEKAGSRFYPLILDFLQHGRVPDARHRMHQGNLKNLFVVLTANDGEEIPEAVQRRCFRVEMDFLPANVEIDTLRKTTGAPIGAVRLIVQLANAIRTKGESKPSLQELRELLRARELALSSSDADCLLDGFLVKTKRDRQVIDSAVGRVGAVLYGEFRRG
jgi:MoxR-like ATPase